MLKPLRLTFVFVLAASLTTVASPASAQTYPAKQIRWIVPFPPGGSVDILARLVSVKLSQDLGQQVIVENRAGASGNIGTEIVARAAPDGYTIGSNTVPFVANTFLYSRVPYDVLSDFAPVSMMASTGSVLAVHPSVPVHSVRQLLDLARAKPGALNYGSAGVGSNPHIAGELFNYLGKVNLTVVHFKGGAPAVLAAISGETEVAITSVVETAAHVVAGRLRALGVTGTKRFAPLPNVPTIAEAGLPGYEFNAWHIMLAPRGTPGAVVARLNEEVKRILRAPGESRQYEERGLDVIADSPEECATYLRNEVNKWGKVIKERGMRAE
ncbi:MAG TPA: tripartite tricarboxylate transporter substrate binding protein [Burkholderiales bacterium]|nr:tripartite tricarboxylate transporter substrate binding protein [Burkholderiales bacterium]